MSDKELTIAQKLNTNVFAVIGADNLIGFEKAYLIANAASELKTLLSPEYMKPIMALQGNRLGFKTDKDTSNGYSEDIVKNCLIEAVLTGVQPFGNQFNIIQSNCYITKEGFGYLLANLKGLNYEIIPGLPRINAEKTGAAVIMKTKWSMFGGETKERDLEIAVKMNSFMGTDAVIGKATRKARAWLFHTITGSEIMDGDAADYDAKAFQSQKVEIDREEERKNLMIEECEDIAQLEKLGGQLDLSPAQIDMFEAKKEELTKKNKKSK